MVRCARCGNENSDTNRFCGMCGATLLQAGTAAQTVAPATPTPQSPTAARPPVTPPPAPARPAPNANRPAPPATQETPAISGPSFLGLNQPATSVPRPGKGNPLSIDPSAAPSSRNLDYLLEDDEPPKRGGAGKFILILVALALAVGMGYLRWRNQGFGWLNPSASKHSAAAQNSDANSPAAPNDSASSTPAPPAGASAQPAGDSSSSTNPAAGSPPATSPANGAPAAQPTAPATASPNPAPDAAASPSGSQPPASSPAAGSNSPATSSGDADATDQPKPAEPAAKPPAAKPAKPTDVVTEAQRYIYGKGVPQNCDRGLKILKPAADHANPKAMIEMGALYSAGLCTPRDLPTAYRWFAQALRKDPDDQNVKSDLEKLWGEMTQPERQLAIKMSQ
jgi:zinc-ribbon domain/Sel1 repeat